LPTQKSNPLSTTHHTDIIRAEAERLGFGWVGFARAEQMQPEARRLEAWLNQGFQGEMSYMERNFEVRTDPRRLVEGAKTVVSLVYNYYTDEKQTDADAPKISKYAYGKDYHDIIKVKLRELLAFIHTEIGEVAGRCFVDSAPILERDWAQRAGMGWTGKNTLLIHPKKGSFFFLAELVLDLELCYDDPMRDFCGTCTRCIDACPTAAISPEGYLVDGSKCISYLTIELRNALPAEFLGKMDNWAFGCDVCQDVCPWNRFSKPHAEPNFEPHPDLLHLKKQDWIELTEDVFKQIFQKSAVKRAKFAGLQRNIEFLK
jgi:epoxyqueuosine reductase